jgi:hypothetical protein
MINEFYTKEARTPEEGQALTVEYLNAISKAFVDIADKTYKMAKESGFRGSENSLPDNQLLTRKLIEQHGLGGMIIDIIDGPKYSLESKRVHPICYSYRDNNSSYTFGLRSFVSNIFEKEYTVKKFDVAAPEGTKEKLEEMAETMRKYFTLKPHYNWSVNSMCVELLETYFLLNVPSALISVADLSSARFLTGEPGFVTSIKQAEGHRHDRIPKLGISYYLDNELYHKMNLVDASNIDKGLPITGDQTKNIPMWTSIRDLGKKWITDERMAEINVLAIRTLNDSKLTKDFNKIL